VLHSHDKKIKGGLALGTRSGWEEGGDNGPALHPGDTEKSLLLKAVRYKDADFEMPPEEKLPAQEIAVLEQWVRMGAPDPRVANAAKKGKGIDIAEGRKFWGVPARHQPDIARSKGQNMGAGSSRCVHPLQTRARVPHPVA
jgi:hypothetical protein